MLGFPTPWNFHPAYFKGVIDMTFLGGIFMFLLVKGSGHHANTLSDYLREASGRLLSLERYIAMFKFRSEILCYYPILARAADLWRTRWPSGFSLRQ